MKRRKKKSILAILCSLVFVISSSVNAFALSVPSEGYNVYRTMNKTFYQGKARVNFSNKAYYKMYSHLIFGTTVRSSGENRFTFNTNKTGYKLRKSKRSITCFANGMGFDDVKLNVSRKGSSVSGNVSFTSDKRKATVYDSSIVEYYADTNIWNLYNYGETYETSFQIINSKNKVLKTVFYETTRWYY